MSLPEKIIVVGGLVASKHDGQIHYINADKLCGLYGMTLEERQSTIRLETAMPNFDRHLAIQQANYPDVPVLCPLTNGEYREVMQSIREHYHENTQ